MKSRTALIGLFIIVLLIKADTGSVVNVTQSSYQAEENQDVTLEWTFNTRTDGSIKSINIYCEMLNDLKPFILFHLHEGVEVSESQNKRFAGRIQFNKDVLREGRLKLHMSRLRTDDSGVYVCDVLTVYGEGSRKCLLNVTAERVRPKPQRDPSTTESPSQPERLGWIVLYCAVGLMMVVGTLLGGYYCLRRKHPMVPSPPAELDPMNLSS